ncbi:MAG: hypothetical protein ACD_54C00254G0001 [uncultured bacterium]|uniref:hypothetical protein n=1 Tax=Cypionkella sp. TaxID=2811411 RepID=UPI00028593A3|nr:hypothetical protein [Cypionkella sp.]EKD61400.1 MAG: hypothetical protein ACD_54C00254G0001 [uncultured bacterium]MDO8327994.1 hypothetical protein [Cypionkella sp.]
MVQTDAQGTDRGGARVWIFRVLLVAGAVFMVYSWFSPWWSAKLSVIPGENHLVLRPWGIQAVAQVRANSDESLYSMPWFFAPFMWTYLTACMLALVASLFVDRQISIGRINLSLATALIGIVGLTYLAAVGIAYGVGELRAGWAGTNFIGKSQITNAMTGTKIKMVSDLQIGYWLAVGAGAVLFVLALLRRFFVR